MEELEEMEKFLALGPEKRQAVLCGAMRVFASAGYKKAFVSEIAREAGISKAMVFYYFGSKKALYRYLIGHAANLVTEAFQSRLDLTAPDFFDRVLASARVKMSILRRNPAVLSFLGTAYFETDPEAMAAAEGLFAEGAALRQRIALEGADLARFKDDVDPRLVMNILERFAEGYASEAPRNKSLGSDELMREFEASLQLMKRHFYKEEYLP